MPATTPTPPPTPPSGPTGPTDPGRPSAAFTAYREPRGPGRAEPVETTGYPGWNPAPGAVRHRPSSALDELFGAWWVDPRPGRRDPYLVGAGAVVGLLAMLLPSDADPALGWTVVVLAGCAVVAASMARRANRADLVSFTVSALLVGTGAVSSTDWAVMLCWLTAAGVLLVAATRARTVGQILATGLAAGFAWLRGLPWLGRSVHRSRAGADHTIRGLVTVVVAAVLVGVFGALFASADGVFAAWVGAVTGDLSTVPTRVATGFAVTVLILSGVVVSVLPPRLHREWAGCRRRTVRRSEWVVPAAAVIGVFALFLTAQARALFGGETYLRATTGLTYASYVHQGFGQLVVVSVLVVLVIAVALRVAPRATAADRGWLRVLLGTLSVLSLAVAASALHRLALYDAAYGASRLRLLVAAFEIWVIIVLALVGWTSLRLRGTQVPRTAVGIGAVIIFALTAVGPDRLVADRNVDRYAATGQIDWRYLATLSADAVPALDRLPEPYRSCTLHGIDLGQPGWVNATVRAAEARRILRDRPVDPRSRPDDPRSDCGRLPER